jgi:hypothetical protein
VDAKQLAELERWANHLRQEGSNGEARAAGRAILMLVAEVERLREGGDAPPPSPPPAPSERPPPPADEPSRRPGPVDAEDWLSDGDGGGPTISPATALERVPRRRDRAGGRLSRRNRGRLRLALAVVILGALIFGAYSTAAYVARPDLSAGGPAEGAKIGATRRNQLVFWVNGATGTLRKTHWHLDGNDVTQATRLAGDRLVYDATKVPDGSHTLTVSAAGPLPGSDAQHTWRFAVDTTPPAVVVRNPEIPRGEPIAVHGTADPGTALTADGRPVGLDGRNFTLSYRAFPAKPVILIGSDGFGNRTVQTIRIQLGPRRPAHPVRAVHVTADAWADAPLRNGVLGLIAQGRINAVELDLKDEGGIVGWNPPIPLAHRVGAAKDIFDLRKAIDLLHARGVRVIGRLVAFRDPTFAAAEWKAGHRDEVIQSADGQPYSGYGGFANFANPVVRKYQIDIAKAAAAAGIDDVLYDYVRRPDGPISSMRFPGLRGTPEASIASFLTETRKALPKRVYLGASVFGVAATRPLEVAQNIPMMAKSVDYVAPMVYPSHWGPGEYNVSYPNAEPYAIVQRSLRDFERQTRGTGARVVPWLQDFSLGVTYGPKEVRAQIDAARADGIPDFLLWDPLVTYTTDALDPTARKATWPKPSPAAAQETVQPTSSGLKPNELGEVPVLMYHQIRADGGGAYDLTPAQFRHELDQLYRQHYRPVRAIDLIDGTMNVPTGTTPVVMTFDDSTKEQFAYGPGGAIKPDTAIGILLALHRKHPDWKLAGTFYPNREPFAGVAEGPAMLRWLVAHGFELGNHTYDHIPFNQLDETGVQKELVKGERVITSAIPGYKVETMALPLGVMPKPASLAVNGSWDGDSYHHLGVLLVGAEPSPSPFSSRFDPAAIPRIRTSPWDGKNDFGSGFWLRILQQQPERRYVSDGNPKTISFPRKLDSQLAARFDARAKPY